MLSPSASVICLYFHPFYFWRFTFLAYYSYFFPSSSVYHVFLLQFIPLSIPSASEHSHPMLLFFIFHPCILTLSYQANNSYLNHLPISIHHFPSIIYPIYNLPLFPSLWTFTSHAYIFFSTFFRTCTYFAHYSYLNLSFSYFYPSFSIYHIYHLLFISISIPFTLEHSHIMDIIRFSIHYPPPIIPSIFYYSYIPLNLPMLIIPNDIYNFPSIVSSIIPIIIPSEHSRPLHITPITSTPPV